MHGNKNLVRVGKIVSGIGLFCLALVNVTQLKLWGLGCGSGYSLVILVRAALLGSIVKRCYHLSIL